METWYRRVIDADPDRVDVSVSKANYLAAKWYGSTEDVLQFADELYRNANWRGHMPMAIARIHQGLASDAPDRGAYYREPRVWADVSRAFEPYLRAKPEDVEARSMYCYFACRAERWDVARRQFAALGNNVIINLNDFHSVQELDVFRRRAESAGKTGGL